MSISKRYAQPSNPTDEDRYNMLKMVLEESKRLEDFDNIIELLSPPIDITKIAPKGMGSKLKVGIIGGGLSGLASAFELRKLGFNITIFEMQKNRIGGKVYTYYFDKKKENYADFGPMRIPVSHETTWHYINQLQIKTSPFIQINKNAFRYVRNIRVRNDIEGKEVMEKIYPEFNLTPLEKSTPWPELISYALNTLLMEMTPEMRREILEVKKEYSNQMQCYNELNLRQVMKRMGLSQACIDLLSRIDPFLGYFYYTHYTGALQDEYPKNFSLMYKIDGGFDKLPIAFYNSLLAKNPKEYKNIETSDLGKVIFKMGMTVQGIYKDNFNNKIVLEYNEGTYKEPMKEAFDFIVCTLPLPALRNITINPLFTVEKMQAIKEVNYIKGQKTFFMCKNRFWERGNDNQRIIGGGSYTDLPIGTIWYPSDHPSIDGVNEKFKDKGKVNDKSGVLLASYSFDQDASRLMGLDEKTRIERMKRQVEAVNGLDKGYLDYVVEDVKTVDWGQEKGFWGAFCCFMPEQRSIFSYDMIKPEYDNRIYFAGDHASPNNGWMQGALNSAMKAANALAEYCKGLR